MYDVVFVGNKVFMMYVWCCLFGEDGMMYYY